MSEEVRKQASDAIRYYAELNRRVSGSGVDGITGLLDLFDKLRVVLAEVSVEELEWALGEIKRLLDGMIQIDSELSRLQAIQAAIGMGPEQRQQELVSAGR